MHIDWVQNTYIEGMCQVENGMKISAGIKLIKERIIYTNLKEVKLYVMRKWWTAYNNPKMTMTADAMTTRRIENVNSLYKWRYIYKWR